PDLALATHRDSGGVQRQHRLALDPELSDAPRRSAAGSSYDSRRISFDSSKAKSVDRLYRRYGPVEALRHVVRVQAVGGAVRRPGRSCAVSSRLSCALALALVAVARLAASAPTRSSPLGVAGDGHVFVVNPDANTVSRLEFGVMHVGTLTHEQPVGTYPR